MEPRDVASRDLLIGLLALQNGLIDQDVLVAVFRAWTRDKTRPIADFLVDRGAIDADERALLERLAEKHLARHGGNAERSLAAIKAERSIREGLSEIADSDIEATLSHVGSGSGSASGRAEATISFRPAEAVDGQRFRVLRPHARGGLGAVFVAIDEELKREVALKQILDHHADDPTSRTRFVLEAEITGGLEHPGIVPVYGLGSYGDGRPYYAMRFIRGESLKEAIAAFHDDPARKSDPGKRSLALRKLLRRFVDVCNAIDYAHTRGVLHRDIKPANVVLGKHGETLVVDWGLAKLMGRAEPGPTDDDERTLMPSSASGSAETLPGSATGTPAYMSPEQARGDLDRLGPRSDVYSLGATLYCLLTGQPAFTGENLSSVLKAVKEGKFPAPRVIDPTVDRALEAVCQKAMATAPEGRYATAKALADDVERWAADEPVSARREPISVRVGRWAKRHRTKVVAVGLSLLTAVVLLAISNVRVSRAQRETAEALVRADLNFRRARQAVEESFTIVSEDLLLEEPGMQPLREKLLQTALKYHEAFLKERSGDPGVEAELADSHWRYGNIAFELGRRKDARDHFREASRRFDDLAGKHPDRPEFPRKSAMVLAWIGWSYSEEQGGYQPAIDAFRKAIAGFENLSRRYPRDPETREGLSWSLGLLGHKLSEQRGNSEEIARVLDRAREIRRELVAEFPESLRSRKKLVELNALMYSRFVGNSRRQAEALAASLEVRAMLDAMLKRAPNSQNLRSRAAGNHYLLASLYSRAKEPSKAVAEARLACEILSGLAAANPDIPGYRELLAASRFTLGNNLANTGDYDGALPHLNEAADLYRRLMAEDVDQIRIEKEFLSTLSVLGSTLIRLDRFDDAIPFLKRSIELHQGLVKRDPGDIFATGTLLVTRSNLGICLSRAGRHAEAVQAFDEARLLAKESFGDADWSHEGNNAITDNLIRAYSLREVGQIREADEMVERHRQGARGDSFSSFELARYDARGAAFLAQAGGPTERIRSLENRALDGLRRAAKIGQLTPDEIIRNSAFDALRSHPGYRPLLLDLAFPANPFAR